MQDQGNSNYTICYKNPEKLSDLGIAQEITPSSRRNNEERMKQNSTQKNLPDIRLII